MGSQSKERCEGRGRRTKQNKNLNEETEKEERGEAKQPGMRQVVPEGVGNYGTSARMDEK